MGDAKKPLTIPRVHLNGTSQTELLDLRFAVVDALNEAGDAFAKASPNGRDYYPDGPEAFESANKQHERRIDTLKSLIKEMYDEVDAIQDQT